MDQPAGPPVGWVTLEMEVLHGGNSELTDSDEKEIRILNEQRMGNRFFTPFCTFISIYISTHPSATTALLFLSEKKKHFKGCNDEKTFQY